MRGRGAGPRLSPPSGKGAAPLPPRSAAPAAGGGRVLGAARPLPWRRGWRVDSEAPRVQGPAVRAASPSARLCRVLAHVARAGRGAGGAALGTCAATSAPSSLASVVRPQ